MSRKRELQSAKIVNTAVDVWDESAIEAKTLACLLVFLLTP
jgi:hypothetical protein